MHAAMMVKWVGTDGEAARFAIRGLLPHLLLQNILTSRIFLSEFITLLSRTCPTFSVHATLPLNSDEVLVTSEPALNFLQLLVRVCQRGEQTPPKTSVSLPARTAWLKLMAQYKASSPIIAEVFSNQVNTQIGQVYFGFAVRKLTTPFDMIASLFGGGNSGASESHGGARGRGRGRGRGELTGPGVDELD